MDIFYIFAGLVCFCSGLELGYIFGYIYGKHRKKKEVEDGNDD